MAPRLLCCPTPLIPDFGTTGLSLSRGYRLPWRVPCAEGPQVWSWGQTHSEHCRPLIRMLGATRDAVAGVFTRRPPLSTVSRKNRFAGWKEGRGDLGQNHSPEAERGGEVLPSDPKPREPAGAAAPLFSFF
ncbi:hypothetical protein VULLAG_LOCUS1256 [Vulpes lagopus]